MKDAIYVGYTMHYVCDFYKACRTAFLIGL